MKNIIKYIILLLTAALLFISFISCRKDGAPQQKGADAAPSLIKEKEVWLYLSDISALTDASGWKQTYSQTDAVVLPLSKLKKLTKSETDKIKNAVAGVNMKLAVECSGLVAVFGTDTFHSAEKSMAYYSVNHSEKGEYTALAPLIESGCEIDYLIFQNPVVTAMYPGASYKSWESRFMTEAEAVSQTVEAMKYWREHLPSVQFIVEFDFYKYAWEGQAAYTASYGGDMGAGDLYYMLDMLDAAARKAAIPLFGVAVNYPYEYAVGKYVSDDNTAPVASAVDWMGRLAGLANECAARDINFSFTINSALAGTGGTDERYYNDMTRYLNKFTEAGGNARIYLLKGGVSHPSQIIPDTLNFSLTYDLSKLIGAVKRGEELKISLTSAKKAADAPQNIELVKEWTFDTDAEGWGSQNDLASFYTQDGWLGAVSNGSDPFFCSPDDLDISAADCDYLYIKYMNVSSMSDRMEFFFSTAESPLMDEIKTIKFEVGGLSEDDMWSEIYIPLKNCEAWKGKVTRLRLDSGMTAGEFRFDTVALYKQN